MSAPDANGRFSSAPVIQKHCFDVFALLTSWINYSNMPELFNFE